MSRQQLILSILLVLATLVITRPASANHPQVSQMDQVVRTAHELEQATRHVYQNALQQRHHGVLGVFTEGAGIAWLRKLSERAAHFHREVESYRRDPSHSARDYRRLWDTFLSTRNALYRHMHASSHVVGDFQRVEQLMNALSAYYGGSALYPGNGHPYGQGGYYPPYTDPRGHGGYSPPYTDPSGHGGYPPYTDPRGHY